ncbi:MAG TPA: lysylphosphatidylglycerol synthase transmembrane domain-containing protein, partial [Acidimicrobiales bacterium]|nr:lysylphosphatidylglycerol synthase transmembrane domain-containing protein [Acidimicrobiales bacterium]
DAGIEAPELTELRRFSWGTVLLVLGSIIGMWAIIGVLIDVAASFSTIKGASWGWVAAVFVLSLFPPVVEAWGLVGSVFAGVPSRPVIILEFANDFTGLVGGTPATLAMTIRFFQKRGATSTYAVTAGALNSATSWIVKGVLFLVSIPLAIASFNPGESGSGTHSGLVHLLLVLIIVVGVVAGIVGLVLTFARRIRLMVADKLRPLAAKAFEPVRNLARQPRRFAALVGGNLGSQLATALALGASLHAFGQHLSLAEIFFTITIASMLGGVSPVPGGMGVVEAGMIAGLAGFGVPEDVAVAAVFVQRLFTAYLPPIWGYAALLWLRRHDFL